MIQCKSRHQLAPWSSPAGNLLRLKSDAGNHMNSQLSATSRNQIRNRSGNLAGANIRNYPQPPRPGSATAGIYHRAGRPPAIRLLESSDNHPTDSANLPIIYRHIAGIYRSEWCRVSHSSDSGHLIHEDRRIDMISRLTYRS